MAYYRVCPDCGAHLDPGEKCDCRVGAEKREGQTMADIREEVGTGQYCFRLPDGMEGGVVSAIK